MRLFLSVLLLSAAGCRTARPAADAPAQAFAGTWTGTLARADQSWDVTLTLRADGRAVTGTSRKRLGQASVAWEVVGVVEGDGLRLAESRVLDGDFGDQPRSAWCARSGRLRTEGQALSGPFESASPRCPPAVLTLRRPVP